MSFNYRRSGTWKSATIKTRMNGQWVSVGDENGGGGSDGIDTSRYYATEPTRNGDTIVYDGSNYSSLQAAHDALSPGDTLKLDSSNSPYVERLEIGGINHITITSTDTSNRAWVEEPDTNEWFAISTKSDYSLSNQTTVTQEISGGGTAEDGATDDVGDEVIHVDDASGFSVGDEVVIAEDNTRPYEGTEYDTPSDGRIGGARYPPDDTVELRQIADVDASNDTITVNVPMMLPFPLLNTCTVEKIGWTAEDVRISHVNVRGQPGASGDENKRQPLKIEGIRDIWIDNMEIRDAPNHSLQFKHCYHGRTHNIDMYDGNKYGINLIVSTHMYCTNTLGDNIVNYVVRASHTATDIVADGLTGRNFKASPAPVCASHWGGFYVTYKDVTNDGEQVTRFRTQQMVIDGFESNQASGIDIVYSQRPIDVIVKNGTIGNYTSDSNDRAFHFRLDDGDRQEKAGNVHIENIEIEERSGVGPEDLGTFDENAVVEGLHIKNVTYGDTQLTHSHVEQWSGYSTDKVSNLTVE